MKELKGRTWVMGDIHGANKALLQCLERSGFDRESDTLIQLGDVVDGWSETFECVETLLSLKNLIAIRGNHDEVFNFWIEYGAHKFGWTQGAEETAASYIKHSDRDDIVLYPNNGEYVTNLTSWDIPPMHQKFFRTQHLYYIDSENRCFVHGGFNRHLDFKGQWEKVYCWDRDLWMSALSYKSIDKKYSFKMKDQFKEVFIGHTATVNWSDVVEKNENGIVYSCKEPITTPMQAANIWNLDTGAGFKGKLTIMDVETKEYFQSDSVNELYKGEKGRT